MFPTEKSNFQIKILIYNILFGHGDNKRLDEQRKSENSVCMGHRYIAHQEALEKIWKEMVKVLMMQHPSFYLLYSFSILSPQLLLLISSIASPFLNWLVILTWSIFKRVTIFHSLFNSSFNSVKNFSSYWLAYSNILILQIFHVSSPSFLFL